MRSRRKVDICFLTQGRDQYGSARKILGLSSALKERGWKVLIAVEFDDFVALEARRSGIEVIVVRSLPSRQRWPALIHLLVLGLRLRAQLTCRLVHVISPVYVPSAIIATLSRRGRCVFESASDFRKRRSIGQFIFRSLARTERLIVIANSRHNSSTLGIPAAVIFPGSDPARLAPTVGREHFRETLGLRSSAIVLAVVGRISEEKGQLVACEVLALLRSAEPDVHLLLVGGVEDPAYERQLVEFIRTERLDNRVHRLGYRESLGDIYAATDLLLNCRRTPEPFGRSLAEAMIAGVPVIAHAAGGPREFIEHGRTGWLVEQPTGEAFAAVVREALADPATLGRVRHAATAFAATNLTLDAQVDRYERLVLSGDAQGRMVQQ